MTEITFTDKARDKALNIQQTENLTGQPLRVGVKGGGCSGFRYDMFFDAGYVPTDMDHVFKFGDLTVVVDQVSFTFLDGMTVDYLDGLNATGFKFINPNQKSTCGCGNSFDA